MNWPANGGADTVLTETALTEDDAEAHVHGICFKTGPPRRLGLELEWLVHDVRNPLLRVPAERISAAVAGLTAPTALPRPAVLPGGSVLTVEPGGQLELSSAPAATLGECVTAVQQDLAALHDAGRQACLALHGDGYDPLRPPRRVLDLPRYAAMEEFFDREGPWGREMMCNTASVQVCVDAGHDSTGADGFRSRWRLAHDVGPVLVAAFANSPLRGGRPSGWRSTRQQVWSRLDPGRTLPPRREDGTDPRAAWAAYSLDATLMCLRRPGSPSWAAPPGLTFRGWLRGGGERRPTVEDLDYHLTTLFPPVRPRGHLELRMIDAQPGDGWIVPAAVTWALFGDPRAAEEAMTAAEPLWRDPEADPWRRAARQGPADPALARASQRCFGAAAAALDRADVPASIRRSVASFTERYVARCRCPADDQLEGIH